MFLVAPSERSDKLELLDTLDCDIPSLRDNLRDIAKFNSFMRTRDAVLSYIKMIITTKRLKGQISILDLCAGSADIPVYIIDWGRKNSIDIKLTALDISKDIIFVAKEETKNYPEIDCVIGDVFNLPYENDSFNIVICSQAFHHFNNENCIKVLKIMYSLCSDGIVVNDLRRAWINYFGAILLTKIWNLNYMSINDAPLSILRAFTKDEFAMLGKKSEIPSVKCHSFFIHSLQLVALK